MRINPDIDRIIEIMKSKNLFLITAHMDPDGDSIGSQMGLYYALANAGKQVVAVNQGAMPEKYQFLDPNRVIKFVNEPLPFTPEVVFFLECPQISRIGFVQDLVPQSAIKINIDHHLDNDLYGDINVIDTGRCAVGELIYCMLKKGEYKITPKMAENLYAAVMCDTGNFKFSSTTSQGMKIAAELVEHGANPKWIYDHIFAKFSPAAIRLLGHTLVSLTLSDDGRISFMKITRQSLEQARARMEDSEGFVDYTLAISGVDLGLLFKEVGDNEVKVSVRSQDGLDAMSFARQFNGGGHINAAGFTRNGNIDNVISEVLADAREYLRGK